jgi:hypothetical protein
MRRFIPLMALIIALFGASSCQHKDLCYKHPHTGTLNIVFDWHKAPDANPASMTVYLYPRDTDDPAIVYTFTGKNGGTINITGGTYDILAYNGDSDAVQAGGTDAHATHYLYTRDGSITEPSGINTTSNPPRTPQSADEPVVITADQMWGASRTTVDIYVKEGETQTIILEPEELTCTYHYEIRHVSNLAYVSALNAALSGMSGRVTVSDGSLHPQAVTLPLEATCGDSIISGTFYTFGHNTETAAPKHMMLYVRSTDGSLHTYGTSGTEVKFDVTDQVTQAPDRRHVTIIIDSLQLYRPENPSGGYTPTVDNWLDEDEYIIL